MITVASYGGGINSKAMLIECVNRGINIDLILFADTGGEKPHTYFDIKKFSKWLTDNGMPEITKVQRKNLYGTYITLEQYCREQSQLPSLAYGFKSCSEKHKIAPQNKFMNNWNPAKEAWAKGDRVQKLVGYDADEHHRIKDYDDKKYVVSYPLVDWGMGREQCIKTIKKSGLEVVGKSACFFCPSSKPNEILELKEKYPSLLDRALKMEASAELTSIKGLGRNFAWSDVIKQEDMFGFDLPPEIDCGCYDG